MRKSMLAKLFFINIGIDITVKTDNGSPTPAEEMIPHIITHPFQISQFSWSIEEIGFPHFYVLQTFYYQIPKIWI